MKVQISFTPASTPCISDIIGFSPSASLSLCTTAWKTVSPGFMAFWIVGGIRLGFADGSHEPRKALAGDIGITLPAMA